MVVLATGGELVGLAREALVGGRAGAFKGDGLEVTGRDRLAVVPADFESSDAHDKGEMVVKTDKGLEAA